MKLILASKNKHKAQEIKKILGDGFEVITQSEAGFSGKVTEDGKTFEENAAKKAEEVMRAVGAPTVADDSGLCVEALGGAPGVFTARYAGEGATDDENISKLLNALKDVPDEKRDAEFVCAFALAIPGKETKIFKGSCKGKILREKCGEDGFGYDPIFYTPVFENSLASISADEKNSISHRGEALKKFKDYICKK